MRNLIDNNVFGRLRVKMDADDFFMTVILYPSIQCFSCPQTQYRGMLVYDVKAVDDDTGVNGILDYSFIYEGKTANSTPEFRINSVTGVISAKVRFDRETQDRYVVSRQLMQI